MLFANVQNVIAKAATRFVGSSKRADLAIMSSIVVNISAPRYNEVIGSLRITGKLIRVKSLPTNLEIIFHNDTSSSGFKIGNYVLESYFTNIFEPIKSV